MKKIVFLLSSILLLTSCNNSAQVSNNLNLKGNPIQIEEHIYKAIEKNGVVTKGDFLRPFVNIALLEQTFLDEINETYELSIVCAVPKIDMSEEKITKITAINKDYEDTYDFKYEGNKLIEILKTENQTTKNRDLYKKSSSLYKYSYDEQGRRIEVAEYDEDGQNQRKVVYEYFEKTNKIISKTIFEEQEIKETKSFSFGKNYFIENHKDNTFEFEIKYITNQNNQIIESSETPKENSGIKTLYFYDENDNLIKTESINKITNQKNICEYKYKYDNQKNWIEKISIFNKKPEFILERKIKY